MALTYENTQRDIQGILGMVFSAEEFTERLAEHAEKLTKLTPEQARDFIKSKEDVFRTKIGQELDRKDKVCDTQVRFAEYVIANCERGVIEMRPVVEGVDIRSELCGTEEPERIRGFEDVELSRVFRPEKTTDPTD